MPAEESILVRGLEAFAELGYEHASARELARRLGVSHNFLNDRYGSKAAFWRAVVNHALGTRLAGMPQVDPSLDDAERLRQTITDFYVAAADSPQIGRIFLNEFTLDSERLDFLYENFIAPIMQSMGDVVDRLVAAGRMAPVPMHVLFFIIIPPISGMVEVPLARRLGRPEPASPEELRATAEELSTLVVNGLLASGPATRS
ncbi:TetR/AcrR family transcriptional regulator [Streptomyces sp. NPDC001714]|uniref:TetR/AcrR family transcriptional regulator n=1 Tax=Streptomyces sp. NPDC001714 TaxID=3364603 RepID=UPI0036988448